jgi:hypothetical protein
MKWVPGTLFPEIKQLGREADVKLNAWKYTSILPYIFNAWW